MGIFSFLKSNKTFFTPEEQAQILSAIQDSEKTTSGEIRIYVESKNPFVDPIDRASEIFFKLGMQNTTDRNGVLLYIAMQSHELALFADEGIYNKVGKQFWDAAVKDMLSEFSKDHILLGIISCIRQVGATLTEKFPYMGKHDKNELSDDIVFGK